MWDVASVMKTRLFVLVGAVLAGSLAPALEAQYLAPRQYLRRLDPNAPSPRPATPPNPGLPPGPVVAPPPALPAAPATNQARVRPEQLEAQKRAAEAVRKRAEAGSASAQYDLAIRYLTGKGVATNLVEARKWLEAAARQGDYWAKKKLAELEAQGLLPPPAAAPEAAPERPASPATESPRPGSGNDEPRTPPAPKPEAQPPAAPGRSE